MATTLNERETLLGVEVDSRQIILKNLFYTIKFSLRRSVLVPVGNLEGYQYASNNDDEVEPNREPVLFFDVFSDAPQQHSKSLQPYPTCMTYTQRFGKALCPLLVITKRLGVSCNFWGGGEPQALILNRSFNSRSTCSS